MADGWYWYWYWYLVHVGIGISMSYNIGFMYLHCMQVKITSAAALYYSASWDLSGLARHRRERAATKNYIRSFKI